MDNKHRQKLVERVARIRSEVEFSRMDFEDARRRLETDKERLTAALDAIKRWDSDATENVIEGTGRMSLDPETDYSPVKGKGKERAHPRKY